MKFFKKYILYADKFYHAKKRVTGFFQFNINKFIYKNFGKGSVVIKPIRVLGKKNISIGNNVQILNNSRIEAISKWKSEILNPYIRIKDNVSVGQNFHLTAGSFLEIGENVVISGNVLVTDIDHIYTDINCNVNEQGLEIKNTKIGEGCFLGYGCVINAGTELGKHCIVGANAVVKGKYDDYSVIVGTPGRVIKRYNLDSKKWIKIK